MTPLRLCLAAAAAALAACTSTNPPLIFGDHVNVGLHIGNDTASGGTAVSLGYKARSVAIVPVSTLDGDGAAYAMKAHDGDTKDALSVFAVFEGNARTEGTVTEPTVRLGQVFSTGLAAQALTGGYECRSRGDTVCTMPTPTPKPPAPAGERQREVQAAAADRPYQRPLVYMRSDVYGFDIGGSVAEQGGQFALGYSGRNLALIPVVAVDGHGKVTRLISDDGDDKGMKDSFSVLGQFKSDAKTAHLGFGLERYFATGLAAQNLGSGLRAAIAGAGAKTTAQPPKPNTALTAASE